MVGFVDNFFLGVALTLPLGPITLEILRRGIKFNFFESLKTVFGTFSAELTYFILVYFGFSKFATSFFVRVFLGIIGVLFLIYFGYCNLKDFVTQNDFGGTKKLFKSSFFAGYIITFFNPLNFFMWVGIIGAFFAKNTSLFVSSGVLGGIFIALMAVSGLSIVGNKIISKNKIKYVSLVAGIFLVYYGLKLGVNILEIPFWPTILFGGIILEILLLVKVIQLKHH